MLVRKQRLLIPDVVDESATSGAASSTFVKNMALPVHRWFRYSAGFSADWVEQVIRNYRDRGPVRVFDPFAGSATTLIAAESLGVESFGIDSHPFVCRMTRAKLDWRTDPDAYLGKVRELRKVAKRQTPDTSGYPPLIYKCYDEAPLADLDALRRAWAEVDDDTPASRLAWLTLVSILRKTSKAGTAPWQYVLPRKQKHAPKDVNSAFEETARMFHRDMIAGQSLSGPRAGFAEVDARTCNDVPTGWNLVITSPPYPNNYDYADATRLEMSFLREIDGWGDLQASVRRHLVRSCSQHVPERAVNLEEILTSEELRPIAAEIRSVCEELGEVRKNKGGKKTYHLMVACYFRDLAQVWRSLRRVCSPEATVCFVVGDSAPYGVYVPVIPWLGRLAESAGFKSFRFERTRDRNVKWKNRKHRVPLQEGRLWVES
ncbi:MAG: DNA methyltransferase [Pirellulaceae bacterium]